MSTTKKKQQQQESHNAAHHQAFKVDMGPELQYLLKVKEDLS